MLEKLKHKLDKRLNEGTLRSLSLLKGIDFYSNDYLGLAKLEVILPPLKQYGATGSRLIAGNHPIIEQLERELADYFLAEGALLFNAGYNANIGIASAVFQKDDIVLYDEEAHASFKDGLRLSFAKHFSFKHNDLADLERLLLKFQGKSIFVFVEGLYSMTGTLVPLNELLDLRSEYPFEIIIDEAHSVGVLGTEVKGVSIESGRQNEIFARVYTFGKAFGTHGACVVGSDLLKQYLINFARSFIYTTALPLESYQRINALLKQDIRFELERLRQNIQVFRHTLNPSILSSNEISPIQMVSFDSIQTLKEKEKKLLDNGFLVKAIYSPTVKKGKEALRICIHSFNEQMEIKNLSKLIVE